MPYPNVHHRHPSRRVVASSSCRPLPTVVQVSSIHVYHLTADIGRQTRTHVHTRTRTRTRTRTHTHTRHGSSLAAAAQALSSAHAPGPSSAAGPGHRPRPQHPLCPLRVAPHTKDAPPAARLWPPRMHSEPLHHYLPPPLRPLLAPAICAG